MQSRSGRCLSAALLGLTLSGAAHAGPVEQLIQVVMHPSDPNVLAVRYANGGGGLFVSTDGAKTWKLDCGAAMFGAMRRGVRIDRHAAYRIDHAGRGRGVVRVIVMMRVIGVRHGDRLQWIP